MEEQKTAFQNSYFVGPPDAPAQPRPEKKSGRICGLTKFQFIVVTLLFISIITGAVLGGIFGSGILRKAKSIESSADTDSPAVATVVAGTTVRPSTTTTTRTATASFHSTTATATPTGISAKSCNNGTTYTTSTGIGYLIQCSIDWPAGAQYGNPGVKDVSWSENVPTLKECMEACSTWNNGGNQAETCRVVVWNYKLQCFLKNSTGPDPDTFYDYANYYIQAAIQLRSA